MGERPVIDYQTPQPRPRHWPSSVTWLVPLVSGAGAGCVLSSPAEGWFCSAVVAGFVVAALSAIFAPRRRLAFGLLGNGVTIVVCFSVATINNWRSGAYNWTREMPLAALLSIPVVVIPGLLGVLLVDSATRSVR